MANCYQFIDASQPDIPRTATPEERQDALHKRKALYQAMRQILTKDFSVDAAHIPEDPKQFQYDEAQAPADPPAAHDHGKAKYRKDVIKTASVLGYLLADGWEDPTMGKTEPASDDLTDSNGKLIADRRFVDGVVAAVQDFTAHDTTTNSTPGLYTRTFDVLREKAAANTDKYIYTQQLANIVSRLVEQDIRPENAQIAEWVENTFALVLGGSISQRASQIHIALPSLEDNVQADIVKDNVLAVSALYFAAQLEELKFFAVADKVVEQFESSVIPMSRGPGGDALFQFMKDAVNRLTEAERRGIYARAFGIAQGSVDEPMPNREFADLWIRFLSAVSVLTREERAYIRQALTAQQVFKNARDLAVNVSLHGYGIAHFAAVELQDTIKKVIKMLSFPDVLAAYGVNDVWQLVERVSGLYLGGSVNSVRQRTLADSGAKIIQWLAKNQKALVSASSSIDFYKEKDLASNVERWLAVTGTDDQSTDKFSEPVSVPQQPTIPNLSLQAMMPQSLQSIVPQVTNNLQGAFAQLPNLGAPAKA